MGVLPAFMIQISGIVLAFRSQHVITHYLTRTFKRVLFATLAALAKTSKGSVMSRLAECVSKIDEFFDSFGLLIDNIIGTCTLLVFITATVPLMFPVSVVIMILFFCFLKLVLKLSRELAMIELMSRGPAFTAFSECMTGLPTIRAYRAQVESTRRFAKVLRTYAVNLEANQLFWNVVVMQTGLGLIFSLFTLLLVFILCVGVLTKLLTEPELISFVLVKSVTLLESLKGIMGVYPQVESGLVVFERLQEYTSLLEQEATRITSDTVELPSVWRGALDFCTYSLRYERLLPLALNSISLTIPAGETLGIVGRSGAGKSSLVVAILRAVEAADGYILMDGVNIRQIGIQCLRSRVTVVPQEPTLFEGPLRFNLDAEGKCTDDELWATLRLCNMEAKIKEIGGRQGLEETIHAHTNLSVGQKQLVCLARALSKKAVVLILDEAASALDNETERALQTAIDEAGSGSTCLTIAHKLTTILTADKIVVLSGGEIVEYGPPKLLRQTNCFFAALAYAQGLDWSILGSIV